jgi:ATP-dependent RNA helicase DDX46/PRP5
VHSPPPEDDKLKAKRAKLEAWKKEREAKKALDEAKAKAMALAGKSVPGESRTSLEHTS